MLKLELPSEPSNALKLADWLEILALLSADGNSSRGDLEGALNLSSVLERGGRDAVERKCLETFAELESRAFDAATAYPFEIDGPTVNRKPETNEYAAYLFCLCLSYFKWDTKRNKEIDVNPWLLFEELSAIAASQFINGEVMSFGTSRKGTKKATRSFRDTVDTLCRNLGEGIGFRAQDTLDTKDDNVDLVAWRNFNDKKTSKLILFGQCAAGDGWLKKLSELQPREFFEQWMIDGKVSPLIRSFYIPHRIESGHWERRARKTGILFDRCRVAYWAFQNNKPILKDTRYRRWYKYILKTPKPL